MSQSESDLVKTITNQYGKFEYYKGDERRTFTDYAREKLKRGRKKSRTITSRHYILWTPHVGAETHTLSLAIWGEMQALCEKPMHLRIADKLHRFMLNEVAENQPHF